MNYCRKAEEGLQKVWREESGGQTLSLPANTNLMAYGKPYSTYSVIDR